MLIVAEETLSPVCFSTGILSPVSEDSSTEQKPSIITPSTGIDFPSLTTKKSSYLTSSTGTSISKNNVSDAYIMCNLETIDTKEEIKEVEEKKMNEEDLKQIDSKIMTIDDFLDNFEIDK